MPSRLVRRGGEQASREAGQQTDSRSEGEWEGAQIASSFSPSHQTGCWTLMSGKNKPRLASFTTMGSKHSGKLPLHCRTKWRFRYASGSARVCHFLPQQKDLLAAASRSIQSRGCTGILQRDQNEHL